MGEKGRVKSRRIAVVGAGVSGLTCGVLLAEKRGYDVTIFAREIDATTSSVAAAIWYPYHVEPQADVERWAEASYHEFVRLILEHEVDSGVGLIEFRVFQLRSAAVIPPWANGKNERYLKDGEIPKAYKYGFAVTVPLIQTPLYLPYLQRRFRRAGGKLENRDIQSLQELTNDYAVIVNCTGYCARKLCRDEELTPGRGVVVMTANPGTFGHAAVYEEDKAKLTYVIPRRGDVVVGGADEPVDDVDVPVTLACEIYRRCCSDMELALPLPMTSGVKVGIRPIRAIGVRLELDPKPGWLEDTALIHNYGHGGAGFTISWGCARDVLRKVEDVTASASV